MWDQSPAYELDYSRDGNWVAYTCVPDHTIWKCRTDGSAHPTHGFEFGSTPAALVSRRTNDFFYGQNECWEVACQCHSAAGGAREELPPRGEDQGVPTWSADGRYLVLGDLLGRSEGPNMSIYIKDVAIRDWADMKASNRFWSPRWLPDGKMIAALTCDSKGIRIHLWPESEESRIPWKEIARMQFMDNAAWSADSKYLYFNGRERTLEHWIYRVNVATSKLERLADLSHSSWAQEGWFGLTPDGTLLAAQGFSSEEIWALKLRLP